MRKFKVSGISLAVCLAFVSFSGYATSLGRINVTSGLGEPLKADIELLSVTPEELSALSSTIPSEKAYTIQGVEYVGDNNDVKVEIANRRLDANNDIKAQIVKNTEGSPVLKLTSSRPISDRYLELLVQADWGVGRLQREYTVLLEPAISTHKTATLPLSSRLQELTTHRGDTLILIARKLLIGGVSFDQKLIGLYENNKKAFTGNNLHRLKVGEVLQVPSTETIATIDAKKATKLVQEHLAKWDEYRNKLVGTTQPATTESEQKSTVPNANDKAVPSTPATNAVTPPEAAVVQEIPKVEASPPATTLKNEAITEQSQVSKPQPAQPNRFLNVIILAVIALATAAWVFLRNKRREQPDDLS